VWLVARCSRVYPALIAFQGAKRLATKEPRENFCAALSQQAAHRPTHTHTHTISIHPLHIHTTHIRSSSSLQPLNPICQSRNHVCVSSCASIAADNSSLPPPFRAEHIGSLKRPSAILEAREKVENGKLSKAELEKIEDKEILRIVKMQRDLGYKAITDGEYRRHMFYDGFFDNLEGMTYYSAHPDPAIFMDC